MLPYSFLLGSRPERTMSRYQWSRIWYRWVVYCPGCDNYCVADSDSERDETAVEGENYSVTHVGSRELVSYYQNEDF